MKKCLLRILLERQINPKKNISKRNPFSDTHTNNFSRNKNTFDTYFYTETFNQIQLKQSLLKKIYLEKKNYSFHKKIKVTKTEGMSSYESKLNRKYLGTEENDFNKIKIPNYKYIKINTAREHNNNFSENKILRKSNNVIKTNKTNINILFNRKSSQINKGTKVLYLKKDLLYKRKTKKNNNIEKCNRCEINSGNNEIKKYNKSNDKYTKFAQKIFFDGQNKTAISYNL